MAWGHSFHREGNNMKYEISCDPTYTAVEVHLSEGERFAADSGAMAWMTSNIKTETSTRGGMMAGLKRKLLAGESFFQNVFYPQGGPGSVTFARFSNLQTSVVAAVRSA